MISAIGRISAITGAEHVEKIFSERFFNKKALPKNSQIQNKYVENGQIVNSQKMKMKILKTIVDSASTISWSRQAILEIDQYPVFAGLGYKSSLDLAREAAQRAHQHAIEYIGKTASDGDRLAAIELGGSPMADITERDAFPEKKPSPISLPIGQPKFDVKYITRCYRMDGTLVGTKVDRFI